jgi:hypothetical protein
MYRYSVDNAITYTSEDFVLFRESPFACWMERLNLENPDHGIPADVGSSAPDNTTERQDDIADTLRTEGRDVVLVEWEMDEPRRRTATLEAMRHGADFVVNGQLALGPLSGSANLLMRTSGYSDLGDYLYVPCDTQGKTNLHSAFRLCFLADLLHSLQGQLPPQMLIIRGGTDVVPLETEEHIYHYRAVKQRFMTAMREFRKHRMPDPAESSHFGRWSDCANEVLKQRALNAADEGAEDQLELQADDAAAPLLATADGNILATSPDTDSLPTSEVEAPPPRLASVAGDARRASDIQVQPDSGQTLAEQARMLDPATPSEGRDAAMPGHTPNLARVMTVNREPAGRRRGDSLPGVDREPREQCLADVTLENLEFIGSNLRAPVFTREDTPAESDDPPATEEVEPRPAYSFPEQGESLDPQRPVVSSPPDIKLHTDEAVAVEGPVELPATSRERAHPLDSPGFSPVSALSSVVDLDGSEPSSPPSPEATDDPPVAHFGWDAMEEETSEEDFLINGPREEVEEEPGEVFSNSLITNDDYQG